MRKLLSSKEKSRACSLAFKPDISFLVPGEAVPGYAGVNARRPASTFPGEMEAVNLPQSRYLQVSNEAPAVKGGSATERSEAPLTAGRSEVGKLTLVPGMLPCPLGIASTSGIGARELFLCID
jgi:hypothetical protein